MELSKIKAVWSFLTGGWSGLITYVLEAVNALLKKLDPSKFKQVAEVVGCVVNALKALIPLLPAKYAEAAQVTADAVAKLAKALEDGNVTEQELNELITAVEEAVKAWKSVK